jgi:DNA-binding NarL/FixJ family response regulator
LVDDDPIVLRALQRLLTAARPHWRIDAAERVESAMTLASNQRYDVVVTDLHMPGLDGLALLERLRLEQPKAWRVVHSSHIESFCEARVTDVAHALIAKPGRPNELLETLDALLARRDEQRDSANGG